MAQRAFDGLALAPRLVGDDDRADRLRGRQHVFEHRLREGRADVLRSGREPLLCRFSAEGNNNGRHAVERLSAVQGSPPDNAEIASRLDQLASLLELAAPGRTPRGPTGARPT